MVGVDGRILDFFEGDFFFFYVEVYGQHKPPCLARLLKHIQGPFYTGANELNSLSVGGSLRMNREDMQRVGWDSQHSKGAELNH